jgi:UDP-GlcNAc:undecaprenyl-phosphate/decaprenyl-phosphate GlcNAc-1-phosphate transferase
MQLFLNFFLTPLFATFVFIAGLYPIAVKIGFTDKPCHRKQHKTPTPLIGGLAIYLALLVTLFLNIDVQPHQIAFITAITLLVGVGLVDDYKNLGVKIRLVTQIAAALIMTEYAEIKIESVGDLFGFGAIHLGMFAIPFTVFAVVGGINAFNMIDGMDGLAGSLILISIASLAGISWLTHDNVLFNYCLILGACIVAFLSLNLRIFGRSNAKVFLGDTGSTMFGFTVCWLAIDASQGESSLIAPSTVLWIIALPLLDSVCIMLRRLIKGRSPFAPDREHLHHIFTVAGYSNNATLLIILAISLTLSIVGIVADRYLAVPEPILFWIFMLLFLGYYWLMSYAWKVMKISRYLRDTRITDRRDDNQRKQDGQRSGSDRRYIPSRHELEKFYKASGLMAGLLRQPFRKNAASAKKNTTKNDAEALKNEYSADDKRNIPTEKPAAHDKGNQNSDTSKPTESRSLLVESASTIQPS